MMGAKIEDKYRLDDTVRIAIEYISNEIHKSFNTDSDTKWIIGKKGGEVKKHLLKIDNVSRKRIVLKLLLSEQIFSLVEMIQCINTGLIKATHLLMRNIYECINHIETFIFYPHSDDIFEKWVREEKDMRWKHSEELKFLEDKLKDEETTRIKKEIYEILSAYAHPLILSNISIHFKDRALGVYNIDRIWLYGSVMLVIRSCQHIYSIYHSDKKDVLDILNKFWEDTQELRRQIYLKRKQTKD